MKKIILCLVSMFLVSSAFSQWQTIYLFGQPALPNLQSVAFTNFYKGMAAGGTSSSNPTHPIIIRSFDNGNTWDTTFVTMDTMYFSKIVFLDSNWAIAVGGYYPNTGIIARTSDFGNTWTTTYLNSELTSVCFPTSQTGYAIGSNGTVLKTTNAGVLWTALNTNVTTRFTTVSFIDSLIGFVSGSDTIFKTIDGGINWSSSVVGSSPFNSQLFFPSANAGYFETMSDSIRIYKTTDLGVSWVFQSSFLSGLYLSSIFFTDDSTGYLAGQFTMLKTSDNGITWNNQSSTGATSSFWDDLMCVSFLNHDTGFAVGYNQYYRTTNAGGIANVKEFPDDGIISISPNPSSGIFTIQLPPNTSESNLEIYNSLGKKIRSQKIISEKTEIDLSDEVSGIYFVSVRTGKEVFTEKIVIEE